MAKRFVSIWFCHLCTDWWALTNPVLRDIPFVLTSRSTGKVMIVSANPKALELGLKPSMSLADARALEPSLAAEDFQPDLPQKLLHRLAEWCIRFTPHVAVDLPDGLILDATGCAHLWGGEESYLEVLLERLKRRGYHVQAAMTDTAGAAWAVARYAKGSGVISPSELDHTLRLLPAQALRISEDTVERLHKLGLHFIGQFFKLPRMTLRRRFGNELLIRIDQVTGREEEPFLPLFPPEPYQERLPCLEPIVTATGIDIALCTLLKGLCGRLENEHKGARKVCLKAFRVDGKIEKAEIETSRPSCSIKHLHKLFENKIQSIDPGLGIELFILEMTIVEESLPAQANIWVVSGGLEDVQIAELVDRIGCRFGMHTISRYVADEHYWPERSFRRALLDEVPVQTWKESPSRPVILLQAPVVIQVTAPIPDYPPMLFRYRGKVHKITKAEGPERIEQEWWINEGQHRDYYCVEDEGGSRYWIFRLGHYDDPTYQWFLHGYFA